MYAVISFDGQREIGHNLDGTTSRDLNQAELMDERAARQLAASVGGTVIDERRLFGADDDE